MLFLQGEHCVVVSFGEFLDIVTALLATVVPRGHEPRPTKINQFQAVQTCFGLRGVTYKFLFRVFLLLTSRNY